MLGTGQAVPFTETDAGVTLTLPVRSAEELDQVVVLTTGRSKRLEIRHQVASLLRGQR
jgi:hypothetical protein